MEIKICHAKLKEATKNTEKQKTNNSQSAAKVFTKRYRDAT